MNGARVDVQCALVDGACAVELVLARLPVCVLKPFLAEGASMRGNVEGFRHAHAPPSPPDALLELFSLPTAIFVEFLEVFDALLRGAESGLLPLLSFAQKLLGGDLERVRSHSWRN